MSTCSSSNMTAGFIDLATYDELEKYMYGSADATAYFVRESRKATWFTQVPVILSRANGTPAFNSTWGASISRAGDYMLQTWLRVTIPSVSLTSSTGTDRLRWTRNLMHNLVQEATVTFNDLVAARFDNWHLDFWAAFTVPAGKRNGYNNMIGTVNDLIQPRAPGVAIPSATLNLPLPFFYQRDTGVSLPTAALPYNDMRINFCFRNWNELLIVDNVAVVGTGANPTRVPTLAEMGGTAPVLGDTQVWANYAIVSNDERQRMACAPRDILIEQVQTTPRQTFAPATNPRPSYDIRLSHAIKVLFFAVQNVTNANEWSNYTSACPVAGVAAVNFAPLVNGFGATDPILQTTLVYENTNRLAAMGSDYFSLVNPYFGAPVIPLETGYHMYTYSLDFYALDPMGSTNYGKLTNVSIRPEASDGALVGQGAGSLGAGTYGPAGSGEDFAQTYNFILTAVNNNIVRISGGALGFPVL